VLVSLFIIPSRKRIREKQIIYIPQTITIYQYVLGGITLLLSAVFLIYFMYNRQAWHDLLNSLFLVPTGILIMVNMYTTNRLVEKMKMLESGDDASVATGLRVAEINPKEGVRPITKKAKPAPKMRTATIQCGGCQNYLKIEVTKFPMTITCPVCNTEGEITQDQVS
jgi:hypothetical protein